MSAGLSQQIRDNIGVAPPPTEQAQLISEAHAELQSAYEAAHKASWPYTDPRPWTFRDGVLDAVKRLPMIRQADYLLEAADVLRAWSTSTENERKNAQWPGGFDLRRTREKHAREMAADRTRNTPAALAFNAAAFVADSRRGGWVIELAHGGANLRVVEPKGRAVAPISIEITLRTISQHKAALIEALWLEAAKPGVTSAGERVI